MGQHGKPMPQSEAGQKKSRSNKTAGQQVGGEPQAAAVAGGFDSTLFPKALVTGRGPEERAFSQDKR